MDVLNSNTRIIAQQTFIKHLADNRKIQAECTLSSLNNQTPHFSLVGQTWEKKNGRFRFESGGQITDELLEAWPELAPLAAIHLADIDGVPLHAVENGFYWAGGTKWNGPEANSPPNVDFLASTLRISINDAQIIVDAVSAGVLTKSEFSEFVDEQKPRWKNEANHVKDFLETGSWPEVEIELSSAPAM